MGLSVAVTGVTGYIGKSLLALLERSPAVDHIVGIDTVEVPIRTPKLEFHTFDIRDRALGELLSGVDVLVHLAFLVDPLRDEELMFEVNVGGFRNVLDALETAGIGKFVYPSSAHAYGAHIDNPQLLTEDAPLRPNARLPYALHKAETESLLVDWHRTHEHVCVSVTRFARTLGPHVNNFMTRLIERPRFLGIRGHSAPIQALHEDDAASALLYFVETDVPGTFNVAPEDAVSQSELIAALGCGVLELPADILFPTADLAWKVHLMQTPPPELEFLMYPVVLANARLRTAGWKPAHSSYEAVTAAVRAHRGHSWSTPQPPVRRRIVERTKGAAYTAAGIALAPFGARTRRP